MIRASNLSKYYGSKRALAQISFEINDGETVGFLGLNGAGKTTALRILACDLRPSSGTVEVGGVDAVNEPHEVRKRIGFLPEHPPVYQDMSVVDYLAFAGELRGMSRGQVKRRMPDVLEITDLTDVSTDIIGTLSHGYRQRVGVAQAIIHQPKFLILDEPTRGLDPVQIVEMRNLIHDLKQNHTVLISSHILTEISQTCDRLMIIQDGRLVDEGAESELASRHGGQGKSMAVSVRGERKAVEGLLLQKNAVTGFECVADEGGILELRVELAEPKPEALAEILVQGGFGLRRLEPVKSELESMFLKLTGASAS